MKIAVLTTWIFLSLLHVWAIDEKGAYNRSGRSWRSYWLKDGSGAKFNGFDLFAKAGIGYGYDDNVYLTGLDELSDTFTNIKAFIDVERQLNPESKLYLSYEADVYRYNDLTDENSDNQEIIAGFDFTRMNLYGKIKDDYIDTSNINGLLFINRVKRTIHEPSLVLGYDFNKISIEGAIIQEMRRYDSSLYDFNDHDKKRFIGSLIFHTFSKTDLYLQYDHTNIDYQSFEMRDGRYNQFGMGLKGNLTPKVTGNVMGGYQARDYDNLTDSFDNVVFDVIVNIDFLKNLSMDLGYLLTANESIIMGDTYYKIDRITLDFNIKTSAGYRFVAGGFYEQDDFPMSALLIKRDDKVSKIYLGVDYEFKQRYAVQLEWNKLKRDSSIVIKNYDDHMYLISFVIKL